MNIQFPVVFAVKNEYQIFVFVEREALVSIKCGDNIYYDNINGIMRSLNNLHKVIVPMAVLDAEKKYSVEITPIIERKPYFTETDDSQIFEYDFVPVESVEQLKILHISDTHGRIEDPVKSAWMVEHDLDLLVLNGDIADSSNSTDGMLIAHKIASKITKGRIPCIFSRGNHDMRGKCAELLTDYSPTDNGNPFYTFRLGSLWGIVLDSAEDKDDSCEEYGKTVCCHNFRLKETEFIKSLIANSENEYNAEGISRRIVISHHPFSYNIGGIFTIEVPIYKEWCKMLRENIKPEIALCGHIHATDVWEVGGERDHNGQACPVVIGGNPWSQQEDGTWGYSSATVLFYGDKAKVAFTNHLRKVDKEVTVSLKR